MKRQWFKQPLHQLLQALNSKEVSLPEIVASFYDRIEQREPLVQAWQYLIDQDDYLAEYEAKRAFYDASPLKGLPFAVKDVIDTADIPTTMGSAIHQERIPSMDASCVTAMKAAGGILLGKTVTTEFAYFQAGKTNNPTNLERTPGGSSSGSAAAVADYMVPIAFGTQTAASVIRPASYCGCIGYVSSKGQFSLRNIQPLAQSLDSLGMLTNDVLDTLLIRDVLLEKSLPISDFKTKKIKFTVFDGQALGPIETAMTQTLNACVDDLVKHHHERINFPFTEQIQHLTELHTQIMAFEVARNLVFEKGHAQLSQHMSDLMQTGLNLPYGQYIDALKQVDSIKSNILSWFEDNQVDVIVAPSASGLAPLKTLGTGAPFMSRAWQVLGMPTVSLPLAYHQKLALGIQFIGLPNQDDVLLVHALSLHRLFQNQELSVSH